MPRTKHKELILHKPSVQDIFYSMKDYPRWLQLLLGTNKPYNDLIQHLMDRKFYEDSHRRVAITKIAADFGCSAAKISKWIVNMYEDIFTLNYDDPEKFKIEGNMHEMYFKNYDNVTYFNLWLKNTPRVGERFSCHFLNAKMGTSEFYVSSVYHEFCENRHKINIALKGGFPNTYRSLLLERAVFFGHVSFMESLSDYDFQIDEKLQSLYKSEKF